MASIRRELMLNAETDRVWDAIRDVGEIHTRFARGFVTKTELEGSVRTVTFVNGFVVREQIVTIDDAGRRLVYAATGGRTTHHNASFEVFDAGPGRTRLVWTTDLLPADAARPIERMIDQGLIAMRQTLESTTG